jgi:UDP-glucose 4-epimerase
MILKGKTILITGGTGSLGSEVASLLQAEEPAEVRIFSRDRAKQTQMRQQYPSFIYIEGDICNHNKMAEAVKNCEIVIHTAAVKDLKTCEENPLAALQCNLHATLDLLDNCISNGIERLLLVSSDKALYPSSVMGMTKAIMERAVVRRIMESKTGSNGKPTSINIVRPGNMLGSSGTVLPLFIGMAKRGEELTVTNPRMSRFLMTPKSCAKYVIYTLKNSSPNTLVIERVPSYTIGKLAQAVVELHHKFYRDSQDKAIRIVGENAGEKLYEVMATAGEMGAATPIGENFLEIPLTIKQDNCAGKEYNSFDTPGASVDQLKQTIKHYEQQPR